ncbi:MAG: B12-binding domain-containing radical SAM protein [Lachnospiraceae bacterium]|nr:B12-binding domain-containing radical SAM protein [Lachnospiraceae bacterium]
MKKFKFLLTAVNAKYIHSNPALYSLRAYAGEECREQIEIAEYTINNREENILEDIYRRQPDVIAFSCYIWNWNIIQNLIVELHKIMPELPIWLGGPEVSYDAKAILKQYPMLTGIMVGEGEATFKELLRYYVEKHTELSQIKGLVIRHFGKKCDDNSEIEILATPSRELTDMDTLPFLYDNIAEFTNRIIYYESSRGCPFGCSYCLSSIDKTVRLRNLEIVEKELQFFLDNNVSQVKFVDRTFNCNHQHAIGIWRYIKEHDNGVTNFHFEIAADIINDEEIELLNSMRPGLVQLEIGVQSVNEQTIEAINRKMNVDHLSEIVSRIQKPHNVHIHLDLIAGLPYEDYASFAHSFNVVYAMRPEQLQLGFLKVLKGSPMYMQAGEHGICYTDRPPYEVLYTNWLSFAQIRRLKQVEEMVELYYNSNQFTHILPVLENAFDTPFAMFEAMADYYEKKGYFVSSPARSYRYEVLLGFVREYDGAREELYRELFTFDMYLRENMKSRPDFAYSLENEKEIIRGFYQKEENEPEYLPGYKGYQAKQMMKMTHMEIFYYPVWEKDVTFVSQKRSEPAYVLFDYQVRSPLDREAKYDVIEKQAMSSIQMS